MNLEWNSRRCAHCSPSGAFSARTSHPPAEVLARHPHAQAFAAIVLKGSYAEAGDSGLHRVSSGDVIFHRAYESHLDRFGSTQVEVLDVPIPSMWAGPVVGQIEDPDIIVRLAERDPPQAIASLLELVREKPRIAADWPDILAADLLDNPEIGLREWSTVNGLHPGSLSRGFRQQFAITPAEFRSVARARKAMRHLGELPLCEVAIESGFADQSHMNRIVKRVTGLSPTRLRAMLAADAAEWAPNPS